MTIYYLYVKTHNVTGLKYLGYTTSKDPHKYTGSGTYWKSHLKVHGKNFSTEIIFESNSKDSISEKGIYYSNLWNVVESNEWANLKPESGEGGFCLTADSFKKRVNTRRLRGKLNTNTSESIAKGIATKKQNGTYGGYYGTPESVQKAIGTRIANNNHRQTSESIAKAIATKKQNGTLSSSSPSSIAKGIATKKQNGTLNSRTPDNIRKQFETRKANGYKLKQSSIDQMMTTRRNNGTGIYEKISCPHCGKVAGKPHYVRWHGDNCKMKVNSTN